MADVPAVSYTNPDLSLQYTRYGDPGFTIAQTPGLSVESSVSNGLTIPGCVKWCGHQVKVIRDSACYVLRKIQECIEKLIEQFEELVSSPNDFVFVSQVFEARAIQAIEYLMKTPGKLDQFAKALGAHVALLNGLQFVKDIDYFLNKRYLGVQDEEGAVESLPDSPVAVAGNLAGAFSNAAGTVLWLEELGFMSMTKTMETIGNIRVFSFVPNMLKAVPKLKDIALFSTIATYIGNIKVFGLMHYLSIPTIAVRGLDLSYALLGIDSLIKFTKSENREQAVCALLYTSSYFSEVLLSSMLVAGVTNLVGLGVMGGICITLGLGSLFYKNIYKQQVRPLYV